VPVTCCASCPEYSATIFEPRATAGKQLAAGGARPRSCLGKQDDAAKTLREGGDKSADLEIAAGDLALAKKDFPTARLHYESTAKLDDRSAAPVFMLGVERRDGKPDVAARRYRDALIREPTHQLSRTAPVSLPLTQRDVSGALAVDDDAKR
jgi:hypothetical protein